MAARRLFLRGRHGQDSSRRLGLESLEERVVLSTTPTSISVEVAAEIPEPQPVIIAPPIPSAGNDLISPIESLQYWQFVQLAPSEIPLLTPEQIATIPDRQTMFGLSEAQRAALTQPQIQALSVGVTGIDSLTAQQRLWLTTAQLRSLGATTNTLNLLTSGQIAQFAPAQVQQFAYWDFPRLAVAQIPWLTAGQLGAITDYVQFGHMSDAQRGALTVTQVQTLNINRVGLHLLNATQRGWLTTTQLQTLGSNTNTLALLTPGQIAQFSPAQVQQFAYWDFPRLAVAQIPWLTANQLSTIKDNVQFGRMSWAQRGALTAAQIETLDIGRVGLHLLNATQRTWLTTTQLRSLAISTNTLNLLTRGQIAQFTPTQVQQFAYWDFPRLSVAQIPWLTAGQLSTIKDNVQFGRMSSAQRAALTVAQVQRLDIGHVGLHLLNATQRGWLTTTQLQTLGSNTNTLALLTPGQIAQFSPAQVQQFAYWDFPRLAVAQIPWLTANQLSTIKDNVQFGNMSDAQRAALTVTQVRQLDANNVGIYLLTELQRGWLSTAQLQSLAVSTNVLSLLTSNQISQLAAAQVRQFQYWDFPLLSVSQIPILTAAQIQSIPGQDQFRRLSEAQRGALSVAQVRSLNVGGVGLALLTPLQRQWISAAQVQTLLSRDFALLTTAQLSLVTPQQFASVANASDLDGLSEQQRRALSSEQILSLPLDLLIRLTGADIDAAKLAGFTPMNRFGVGPDGLSANPHAAMAWQQVLSLVPVSQATHTAVASGEWTDPRIWSNGQVPGNGANVMIPAGIDVQLSEWLAQPLKTVRIDGSLTFNPDAYTQLMVDTIVVNTTGSFHMGTESEPINEQRIARVLFPTAQALDTTWDPRLLSRGLISRGEVRVYGAEKTSFTTFATPPQAGDTVLTLAEVPLNWQVGDRLKLAGTQNWQDDYGTEEVVIRAISGSTVTVDALKFDHQPPAGYELQAYVANMTRNAQFSASHQNVPALQRPHLMFMQNPNVELVDAGVYGLGRTDKSEPLNRPVVVNGVLQPGTGTNPEARYAVHFHHTGVDPNSTPGLVRGTVVDGSPGWGFVNHQSYVIMEDNVAYGVDGAAFVGEDGNEIGAFRHNLAMSTTGTGLDPRTRKEIGDFGHSGDGFWLQGPLIETTGNISAGARHAGFTIFAASSKVAIDPADIGAEAWTGLADVIPVSAVPVANFSDNIAFAGNRGLETWFLTRGLYDLPANGIDNFTAWGNRGAAIQLEYSTRVTINGGTLLGTGESGARGVSMNVRTSDVTYNDVTIHDFEIAAIAASRGVTVFRDGSYRALTGIEITVPINEAREVSIVGNPVFARPTAAWAAGKPSYDISMNGELDLYFQSPETMVASQVVAIDTPATGKALLYYLEQAPGHVPFPSATTAGYVPTSWLNLKNGELQQRFGVSFAGEMIPNSAVTNSRIWGKLLPLA